MKYLVRALAALVGFASGVAASLFLAGAYVRLTYSCQPGPLEPCDSGGYTGLSLVLFLAPVLGIVASVIGYKLAAHFQRGSAA